MIPTLMLYAVVVSVLIAFAARGVEEVCRATGQPVRLVWAGALVLAGALVALAPLRAMRVDVTAPVSVVEVAATPDGGAAAGPSGRAGSGGLGHGLGTGRLAWSLHASTRLASDGLARVLGLAWLAGTLGLLSLGVATLMRYRVSRRKWPWREIAGIRVRVAPAAGPAVLGLVRPEIVVPDWLLATSPEEQRLVVLHECEHVRARDPLTLTAGWLAVALVPWNPVAWSMLRRLRLAVELDCDARVLRRGVEPRTYGSALIDMAGRGAGLPLGMPALAGTRSTLERRLLAMSTRTPRLAPVRAVAFGALAAIALLAACEARMPTAAEIEQMDVAAAEAQAAQWQLVNPGDEPILYTLDGVQVSGDEARALPAAGIARLEVVRAQGDQPARVRFMTDGVPPLDAQAMEIRDPDAGSRPLRRVALRAHEPGEEGQAVIVGSSGDGLSLTPVSQFKGLVVLDGVVAHGFDLRALQPDRVASIEVIKGAAAARLYDDARAEHGVIRITTKP